MEPLRQEKPKRTCKKIYKDYRTYKKPLSKDFNKRCGYCDDDDSHSGGQQGFHIDHFAPGSKFGYECPYSNLVYSCPYCNIAKSNDWVSDKPDVAVIGDEGYIDPCSNDYEKHLSRTAKGRIVPTTPLGNYMHRKLKLGLLRHEWIWKIETVNRLVRKVNTTMAGLDEKGGAYKKLKTKLFDLLKAYWEYNNFFKDNIQ